MKFELRQLFRIESARRLTGLPSDHPCSRLHGHSFQIELTLIGDRQEDTGWVIDYHLISSSVGPVLRQLDHRVLNEVPGLENPTTENLCFWLYEKIKTEIPELVQITVRETPETACSYPVRTGL